MIGINLSIASEPGKLQQMALPVNAQKRMAYGVPVAGATVVAPLVYDATPQVWVHAV
jgi:hypothetical protein